MEEWKPITGFHGYEISSLAQVRSLPREVLRRNGRTGTSALFPVKGRLLATGVTNKGHLTVRLNAASRPSQHQYIHHLVMEAFGPPKPFSGAIIRHLDDDKNHNLIDNLAWGTAADNAEDSRQNGGMRLGERHHNAKLNYEKARYIRESVLAGTPHHVLAKEFKVDLKAIYQVTSGKTWIRTAITAGHAAQAIGRLR